MRRRKVVLDHDDLRKALVRIAHEIVEKNSGRRGDRARRHPHQGRGALPKRLHALVGELSGSEVPLGDLDISFYRDDVGRREPLDARRSSTTPTSTSSSRAAR